MASFHCSLSLSLPSLPKLSTTVRFFSSSTQTSRIRASSSSTSTLEEDAAAMSIDNLRRFINLNKGKWNGSFYQFDSRGNMLQQVTTKLSASSYGEDELMSLIQTLYIKQPSSSTSTSGDDDSDDEWAEYKIKETNMFTVDKYQQIGFFPSERAFALRYQTAGMLDTVLRQGVLGEDDTGEESPRNLKLPSRRPSIVCENCLYSLQRDMRARAFHILEPKGTVDMLLLFLEERTDGSHPLLESSGDMKSRITPFIGKWKGHSMTKRSGVYGSTIAEADTVVLHEMDSNGQLIQDVTSTSHGENVTTTNVHWTGAISENLVTFDGGYQMILLPGGMYMGCPYDVAKSVAQSKSFHLEFCWLETPDKRQRLVRTYDVEGLAVSSTYFLETRL
ncbi:uncharacterized protein LOC130739403 [Lotus japonicus]|uniref:uncharacterized protein LOC130739403 n=1 Tax=Lotus japonicus TaxID=34305 RepID=UPI002584BC1E|nr:uncharacterized protein LOC130739403 [Lotus japonicus]